MPHRLAMVRAVAAHISSASTVDEVAEATLKAGAEYLEAVTSSVWLVSDDGAWLEMRYETNAHPAAMAQFAKVPMDAALPGPRVITSGEACFVRSRQERDQRWPLLAGTPTESEAMVVLPLEVNQRRLGVVSFGFTAERDFDSEDRIALLAAADQCAIGLDRARLYEHERSRTEAQRLLATISGVAPSTDWVELARHAVRACAVGDVDLCGLYVREGHLVRRVALASQAYPELGDQLVDRYPTPLGADVPNVTAIRSGRPERVEPKPVGVAANASTAPGYADVTGQIATGPGWAVPLQHRGVTFGSMIFVAPAGRDLGADAMEILTAAAERTANLLSSATAFAEQRAAIEALHELVLPVGDVAEINGFEIAARYVPLASDGAVGGDWWDALPLPDGRIGFAVGDVAGHGVPAAPVMGQLRNALRMALVSGREPAEALRELSRFLDWTQPDAHCTAIVATAKSDAGRVSWSCAAHPPPLLLQPGSSPTFLPTSAAPPLGVVGRAAHDYGAATVELAAGATLVLYTDGLIEGRQRRIDTGMHALVETAAATPDQALAAMADRFLSELVDRPDDDVCLLLVRRT